MLGGLLEIGPAARQRPGCGARKARSQPSQVWRGVPGGRGRLGSAIRREGWESGRQAVGQEGGRAGQGFPWQAGGQGLAYGRGRKVPFQPGRDAGCEVFGVRGGEE